MYSVLAWSLTTGDAARSAMLMLAFGLGTLPMLFAMGATAHWLSNIVRQPWVRRGAGILILLFGVYALLAPGGHAGHITVPVYQGS